MQRSSIRALALVVSASALCLLAAQARAATAHLSADTPRWYQVKLKGGYPIGCGPTAWAIVYAYWSQHHPGVDLFPGHTLDMTAGGSDDGPVLDATERIAYHLEIIYNEKVGAVRDPDDPARKIFERGSRTKAGSATNARMCDGIKYAQENGFPHSRCFKIYGSELDKFEHIKRYLDANKPVILNMSTKGHRATNHYVVVEDAERTDDEVRYFVNYGWGGKAEWISAWQRGRNTSQVTTVTAAFLIDVSATPLPMAITANEDACRTWCESDEGKANGCVTCSRTAGCGPGYRQIESFREAGKNYYACSKRDTARSEASEHNRIACEAWCQSHPECKTCSTQVGCGPGHHAIKSWRGRGNNYHACAERGPSRYDQASDENHAACQTWCDANEECLKCAKSVGCGTGFKALKSWTGRGKNWHACGHTERQEASEAHRNACEDWCDSHRPECVMCSTRSACGPGYESLKHWRGEGRNWHACKKRESREEASQSHKEACDIWCANHSECSKCSSKLGCGRGYKQIKGWTGRGENWYACRKR